MQSSIESASSPPVSIIAFVRAEYGVDVTIDGDSIVDIINSCASLHYDTQEGIAKIYGSKDGYLSGVAMLPFGLTGELDGYAATVADLPLNNCDDALLRICDCGYAGCACITVQMRVTERHVNWSVLQFAKSKFGPFLSFETVVFDRMQYQAACEKIHSEYSSPRMPPESAV